MGIFVLPFPLYGVDRSPLPAVLLLCNRLVNSLFSLLLLHVRGINQLADITKSNFLQFC